MRMSNGITMPISAAMARTAVTSSIHTESIDMAMGVYWAVLGLGNRAVFEFELPPEVTVQIVRGNRVYATAELEDGTPYVVVYDHKPQI